MSWCRPESTENMEHPADSQKASVRESSHIAEERTRTSGTAEQHTSEQQGASSVPTMEEPAAAFGSMGFMLVGGRGTDHAVADAPTPKATAEEGLEVEEIARQGEEPVAPQCIRVAWR